MADPIARGLASCSRVAFGRTVARTPVPATLGLCRFYPRRALKRRSASRSPAAVGRSSFASGMSTSERTLAREVGRFHPLEGRIGRGRILTPQQDIEQSRISRSPHAIGRVLADLLSDFLELCQQIHCPLGGAAVCRQQFGVAEQPDEEPISARCTCWCRRTRTPFSIPVSFVIRLDRALQMLEALRRVAYRIKRPPPLDPAKVAPAIAQFGRDRRAPLLRLGGMILLFSKTNRLLQESGRAIPALEVAPVLRLRLDRRPSESHSTCSTLSRLDFLLVEAVDKIKHLSA